MPHTFFCPSMLPFSGQVSSINGCRSQKQRTADSRRENDHANKKSYEFLFVPCSDDEAKIALL
jgi:hypothetical protein